MKIKAINRKLLDESKQFYDVIDAAPHHNFLVKASDKYVVAHNCNFTDKV